MPRTKSNMGVSSKTTVLRYVVLTAIALCVSIYIELFLEFAHQYQDGNLSGLAANDPQPEHLIRLLMLWVTFVLIGIIFLKFFRQILHFAYNYRYYLALLILVTCVLFEISGSSIDCLGRFFDSNTGGTGILFGTPRFIRSDEFAVNTPFMFSQFYNYSGAYPYFSDTIRGASTDTFIINALPSWDIATMFRPFLWGYLILGPIKGLSFFWVGRLLALLLVSFELAMVYTNKDKWLSLAAAVLIAFAPIVQWFFSVSLVEMLIFGQGALLCLYHYLRAEYPLLKVCLPLLFSWCLGACILTLYPAWQVPLLYVFAALLIYLILENKKHFKKNLKVDILAWVLCSLLLIASLYHVWTMSSGTIETALGTAYPGNRIEFGGGGFTSLFRYGASIFFPLSDASLNACESAGFFDFFPLGTILSVYAMLTARKADRMLLPLLIAQVILMAYCVFGLPEPLARITLLSFTTTNRIMVIIGFVNLLLLIRTLHLLVLTPSPKRALFISAILALFVTLGSMATTGNYLGTSTGIALLVTLLIGFMLALLAYRDNYKKLFVLYVILILGASGGLVNPVQRGADVIYESNLVKAIQRVTTNDSDALWLVESGYPITNLPLVVGAPTINSTNTYPNLERWRLLDPNGLYEDLYNRYANIATELTQETTTFELLQADYLKLYLNYDDLKKLKTAYLLTTKDYSNNTVQGISFSLLDKTGSYSIYKLAYSD